MNETKVKHADPLSSTAPPASSIIVAPKRYVWAFIAFLSVACLALGYYDMFILRLPLPPPASPTDSMSTTESTSSKDSFYSWDFVSDEKGPQVDLAVPENRWAGVTGVTIGGVVNIHKESRLVSILKTSTVAKVVHVGLLLLYIVSIISYALRLGYLVYYASVLQPSWLTIAYGAAHLFFSIFALLNWAIVGHSFFNNQNRDLYSKLGKWAPYFFYAVVSVLFCVDMAMYVFPEQLDIVNLEGFFETISVMIGEQADLPIWLQAAMHDGHDLNPIGVCSHLFGTIVSASFVIALAIRLSSGVRSGVQIIAVIITLISAVMSIIYSVFRMIVPSKSVSMAVQIVYLLLSIGFIVYGLRGNIWSWSSLVTIFLMISQLRTCLNLGFTNSSLFWTLISPFYIIDLFPI